MGRGMIVFGAVARAEQLVAAQAEHDQAAAASTPELRREQLKEKQQLLANMQKRRGGQTTMKLKGVDV